MWRHFKCGLVGEYIPVAAWCQFYQRFYVQIFCTKVVLAALSSYDLALAKNLYEKCARLTLMKLTAGVETP